MHTEWRGIVGALLVLLVGCAGDGADGDRSYVFDEVRIDAELRPDGSLSVVEERTFDFSGTYRFAFYELPLSDGQEVLDLAVAEDGAPLVEADPDDEEPGTFGRDDEDGLAFTWYYRSPATDEQRTFTISYTVTGAGIRHADAAELYWQWIGDGWEVPTRELVANVELPGDAPLEAGDDLRIWAHGPLDGAVEQVSPRTVRTSVTDVPPATFVELRALFPAADLAGAPDDGRTVRAAIVAEEDCLAVGADAERARARGEEPVADCDPNAGRRAVVSAVLVGLAVAVALGAGVLLVTRGRRAPLPPDLPDQEWSPPTDDPPALVEWLLRRGTLGEGALTATMLDMARRGLFVIEEVAGPDGRSDVAFRPRDAAAPVHTVEEPVRELITQAGDGRAVTGTELAAWAKAHRTEAGAAWSAFTSAVAAEGKARDWQRPAWPFGVVLAVGVLLLVVSGIGGALGAAPVALVVGLATAVVVLACSPLLLRRTAEGRLLATRWERYGAFLRTASGDGTGGVGSAGGVGGAGQAAGARTGLPPLDDALVYAVPLGVAPLLARRLGLASAGTGESHLPAWYPAVWAHGGGDGGFGSLGTVAAAVHSAGSSSSGGGGGFSGGGGGGGGGSGGGAG